MKSMRKAFLALIILATFLISSLVMPHLALADVGPPSTQTTFYFQKNGQPFIQPVKFTVKCYGTNEMGNSDKLLKISEFSETCRAYGCKYDTSSIFSTYKKIVKYCDLEGETDGNKFTIGDFLEPSMSGLSCHRINYDISTGDKYYKETAKYKNCMNTIRKEYYPDNENFVCHQYLVEVPKDECGGYGWITIDDKCYKFTDKTKACIAEKDQKENLCKQYLEDVTIELERNKDGFVFDSICEAKINIPSAIIENDQQVESMPAVNPPAPQKNFFIRIIDPIKCFFFKLFGKSC